MMQTFFNYFKSLILICFLIEHSTQQQYLLGTHFYINQDNILVDNTLKTVSTLARPYDLVAFIRQSERLARVDHLQTYIDAVDDNTIQQTNSFDDNQHDKFDSTDRCQDYVRDGESLIFQILKANLYDTLKIPFQLRNISTNNSFNENLATKISTCDRFCQIKPGLLTFDHLPSISTRYDKQEFIRFDDEDFNLTTTSYQNYEKQARWATKELSQNQTSWLAYVYLSRYFSFNSSYHHSIDCLRCALTYGSNYNDLILIELANIVFRYGYIRDAIIFIEKSLEYHLHSKQSNINSLYIRSILHFYLGNLCTIDNRFVLAIQFYNRTKILLERIDKFSDNKQLSLFSSTSLGSLSISSLLNLSQQKIDALHCHLALELSLKQKHHILQTKLAQLNQLRSVTDELMHLNALIKRDMSSGQSFLNNLRQLKTEQKLFICNWKQSDKDKYSMKEICSNQRKYSDVMKQDESCSIHEHFYDYFQQNHSINHDNYDCYPRETTLHISPDYLSEIDFHFDKKPTFLALRLAAIEQTQSSYLLDEYFNEKSEQITLTSTTTWSTLTSRLPTAVIIQPIEDFILKQSNELYPPLKSHLHVKTIEQQLPTYKDCQIHFFGLPSIGDYPTVWIPLENKGLLNIKQAFYQGLNYQNKHYPLPWSPPLCTLNKPINEHLSIIENHRVLSARSRSKAPINRYDTNMLMNLYFYIDSIIDESLQIEEFGQRLRSVGEKHEHLLPEWIIHLLSSLYWRINGHLPHAIDCGLKAHETIIRNKTYKQWSDLTLINLANILYLWGKYEDALDLTQQAYGINSHEPLTNYFLGNLLALTKNNHTAAQEYYRRTLIIDPTNIYARRQLRLSYCHTMHMNWEKFECSQSNKANCNEKSNSIESMNRNSMLSEKTYKQYEVDVTSTSSHSSTNANEQLSSRSRLALIDSRSSIDHWLNRTCSISSLKREDLLNDARRAYRSYGLCSSSSIIGECSQGFDATNQGHDIGHLIIIYDNIKQTFDYTFLFTNDYGNIFLKESKLKCFIYGTGRKSSKCREINLLDPNEINPKHNMTWWRDPSTLYEHLKELIELLNYNEQMNNQTDINENKFYEKYFSDQYLLSKDLQEKYLLRNTIQFSKNDCDKNQTTIYTPYLSTWISPQTKNIQLNSTFFKHLKMHPINHQPICSYPNIEQINSTKNLLLIDHILQQAKTNLTLYRSETILRPILLNLIFEKNPTSINRDIDDQQLIGSYLATGLDLSEYNTSWLYFHTLSLYWRLMGNASEALNCLFQSHVLSPNHVEDLTYLSMALIIYNSQKNLNQAIYLLYESLAINPTGLLLTHFTLGNAMGKKGSRDLAEQWYQSTLKLKADFEPAKQRLRAIQC